MTNKQFHETIKSINNSTTFEEIHPLWLDCYIYMFKSLKIGFTTKTLTKLFYEFRMKNSKMWWKENHPDYKNHTKEMLIKSFKGDLGYINDRISADRIFRVHWLFCQAFDSELRDFIHPL